MKRPAGWLLALFGSLASLAGQTAGEVEAQKCEERIAAVQRDVLSKYDDALTELQLTFQKAADLEGALAVRAEKQRLGREGTLTAAQFAGEPKALRTLQTLTVAKMQDLSAQLVSETVPKLLEYKRSLTLAGKLDEALAVRGAIERLQNGFLPLSRVEPGSIVPAETLLVAYAADKARADKVYKGQKIVVRGTVGGFRQDPADAKTYLVYLAGGTTNAWVQCAFAAGDFSFREEKQFNNSVLVLVAKDKEGTTVRLAKGAPVDLRGTCEGFDEVVRLAKCDVPR